MIVSQILHPKNNNITLIRLVLASMVIMHHTYAINPVSPHVDLTQWIAPSDSSGSFAVKVFFFLSGLLVVNSLMHRQNTVHYWSHRVFRIFPGLLFVLLVSAFVIGPLFTDYDLHRYFSDKETYKYVFKNLLLNTRYSLPGTFLHNPMANAVNGSLWSLAWEFKCYIITYLVYLLSFKKYFRWIGTICFLLIAVQIACWNNLLCYDLHWDPYYPFYYFLGGIVALHADYISLTMKSLLVVFCLAVIGYFLGNPYNTILIMSFYSFFLLWVATTPLLLKFKLTHDVSYGVYLWGFVVQQSLHTVFPNWGSYLHLFVALVISILMGAISWFLIEKPSMSFAKKISNFTLSKALSF